MIQIVGGLKRRTGFRWGPGNESLLKLIRHQSRWENVTATRTNGLPFRRPRKDTAPKGNQDFPEVLLLMKAGSGIISGLLTINITHEKLIPSLLSRLFFSLRLRTGIHGTH